MKKAADPAWILLGCMLASPGDACTVSGNTLAFGVIDPLVAAASDGSATITVSCPSSTPYSVALSSGNGDFGARKMTSGSHALDYELYIDVVHSAAWGDGTAGTTTVNGVADAGGTEHTIYGTIPWQSHAWPGAYADTIIITVSY